MSTPSVIGSIGTSAVQLAAPSNVPRNCVIVKAMPGNASGSVVYIGFAGVTTTTGYPLEPGAAISIPVAEVSDSNLLYAIGSTTGLSVAMWVM